MIWIVGLPLPPSTNTMYETNVSKKWSTKGGKPFMKVKTSKRRSDELKLFQDRCELFKRQYKLKLQALSNQCKEWIESGYILRLDCYCAFENSRIWTKEGKPQQLDADNRRKALQDAIFALLDIDDKYVFCGNMEKVTCVSKDQECSIASITPTKCQTIEQIKLLI